MRANEFKETGVATGISHCMIPTIRRFTNR